MANWTEHAHILANNGPIGMLGGVSALSFDPAAELLWAGTSVGQVVSHYGSELSRYTSYPAHGTVARPSPTKGIIVDDRHIYSVGETGVKCAARRGIPKWNMLTSAANAPNLALASMCATPLPASSDLILAGSSHTANSTAELDPQNDVVIAINNNTGSVVRTLPSEASILHLRKSGRLICAGTANGHVQLRDPRSLRIEHRLHAHPGGLIDMQADGNLVYTVGWTVRQGHPVPEPLIKVHDLRTMRPLVPIPFAAPGGPSLLAIHPKLSTTVLVSSPQGHFQIVDVGNPGEGRFFQLNSGSFITSLALSPSADFLAFGDADGSVRLWSSSSDASSLRFNQFPANPVEMPDPIEPPPFVNWTTETPLSSIGMPHYSDNLLSSFDYDQYATDASPLFNPPAKIDPTVLGSMRTVDYISYAPLPRHLRGRRNQISGRGPGGIRASALHRPEDRRKIGIPLFRSEKEKEASKKAAAAASSTAAARRSKAVRDGAARRAKKQGSGDGDASKADDDESRIDGDDKGLYGDEASEDEQDEDESDEDDDQDDDESLQIGGNGSSGGMPAYYRLKTIQYSRFGIEDFDFEYYNKTPYSGLETHIQNSYANSYLQALHYLLPFRTVAKAHILQNCSRENCLLCEIGFLTRMLEDAKGANCQATNFLRAFGNSHRAETLGLMDKEDSPNSGDVAYSNLVQSLNRFVLDSTSVEAQSAASKHALTSAANFPALSSAASTASTRGSRRTGAPTGPTSPRQMMGRFGEADAAMLDPAASGPNVSQLFALNTKTKTICVHCGRETHRNSSSHVVDLIYPRKALSNEPQPSTDFASILRASLIRETSTRTPCRGCQFTALFRSRRTLPSNAELPPALSINAAIHSGEQLGYWIDGVGPGPGAASSYGRAASTGAPPNARHDVPPGVTPPPPPTGPASSSRRTFLPPRIAIDVRGDDVRTKAIYDEADLDIAKATMGIPGRGPAIYKVRSMVVQIHADKEAPHLCAIVRVPEAEKQLQSQAQAQAEAQATDGGAANAAGSVKTSTKAGRAGRQSLGPWYLFNDFLVRNIGEEEALGFSWSWKMPAVLMLEREDVAVPVVADLTEGRTSLDPSILCEDINIAWNRDAARMRHKPLTVEELPKKGTLVAIDAEFVALNQEELEIRSDGTRSVIRPTRLSLARVSVLRGEGPDEGKPFIDEHIFTQEEVVDYLTRFSGIMPGDLDPKTSRHTLVPLKVAYKKLRVLVDCGCIFIGHGLTKDFRIINMHVPPSQVIDTVNLYHSALHPRKLSLRFLSWFLLKIDIQGGGDAATRTGEEGHDSIEDALAALRLFRLYEVFRRDGRLDDVMEDLYEQGRRVNWRPPTKT